MFIVGGRPEPESWLVDASETSWSSVIGSELSGKNGEWCLIERGARKG